jgi:hypothetical protein
MMSLLRWGNDAIGFTLSKTIYTGSKAISYILFSQLKHFGYILNNVYTRKTP